MRRNPYHGQGGWSNARLGIGDCPGQDLAMKRLRTAATVCLAVSASLSLMGCAGNEPLKMVAEATGLATSVADPKPWVVQARTENNAYIPIAAPAIPPLCRGPDAKPVLPQRGRTSTYLLAPDGNCRPRFDFLGVERALDERRASDARKGATARALGRALPPPAPARLDPPR